MTKNGLTKTLALWNPSVTGPGLLHESHAWSYPRETTQKY